MSEQTGLSPALSFKGQRQKFNALSIFSHGASEKTCNSVSSKSHQEYDLHPDLIQYKLHTGDHVCVSAKLRQDLPVTRSPHQLPFPPSPLGIVVKDCFLPPQHSYVAAAKAIYNNSLLGLTFAAKIRS